MGLSGRVEGWWFVFATCWLAGCGTTKTQKATEQLLLSDAIDEAIGRKPKGHDFIIERGRSRPAVGRHMSVTGG